MRSFAHTGQARFTRLARGSSNAWLSPVFRGLPRRYGSSASTATLGTCRGARASSEFAASRQDKLAYARKLFEHACS